MILSPQALSSARLCLSLLAQKEMEQAALKTQLNKIIEQDTGINPERGNWIFDPSSGEINPQPSTIEEVKDA